MFALFSLLSVALLLLISLVSGLGISPARKTIDFQPNKTVELDFNIINSEQRDFQAELRAIGELSSIIFFKNTTIQVNSAQYRVPFKIILRFPSYMEPGIHTSKIEISPVLPSTRENMFVAYIALQAPLTVRVPYPAKYLDLSFRALEVDEGTPVPFYITLDNLGSEDIDEAVAEVEVYDPENKLVARAITRKVSVASNSVKEVQALPSPILRKGVYNLIITAYYDGQEKRLKTNFSMGEPLIRVKGVITKKLVKDEINKVIFRAYNDWNTELVVHGIIGVGQAKTEIPVFKLSPGEEREVAGFFEAKGITPGEYNMSLTLMYANQIKTYTFPVRIIERISVKPEKQRLLPLIIGLSLIIILLIILVRVFLFVKKKKAFRERNL
ncbi:MAG TPA: hypothetical protein ENL16_02525 [Candidatus Woesearchaeota archaeon]|nr:hypothetical protein [Candidatus Woesearchaeota archaeon]